MRNFKDGRELFSLILSIANLGDVVMKIARLTQYGDDPMVTIVNFS